MALIEKTNDSSLPDIELMPSTFQMHEFTDDFGKVKIKCEVIKMLDSLYLWIGDALNPTMNDLSMALFSNYESLPVSTKLLGPNSDLTSSNFAKRLSKKLGKLIYVSFNLPADNFYLPLIEKRIHEEFAKNPELLNFQTL